MGAMTCDDAPWPRMFVGDVAVDLVGRDAALSLIMDGGSVEGPLAVVSANLQHIHLFADGQPEVRWPPTVSGPEASPEIRWLTLLDGVPLVHKANALSGDRWPKLSGSDLIDPILAAAASRDMRVGFLGGEVDSHARLRELVGSRLTNIDIAGTWAPTRSELTDVAGSERIAAAIRAAGVEILVVGLGKPLQEEWIDRFGPATGARVLLAFGSAADFLAERVRRAPTLVADAGAEWAWRLMLEPRRLGRRYLIDGPPSLWRLRRTAKIVEPVPLRAPDDHAARGRFVGIGDHADVAVVVVTYNNAADVSSLVDTLRVTALAHSTRLIVVDNGSSDPTVDTLRAHDDIIVIESGGNLGYAGGINVGMPFVGACDAVLILNPDLVVAPDAVTRMLAALDDEIGAVVPLMLDEDGVIHPSLCREPSLSRVICDALFGIGIRMRLGLPSEFEFRRSAYRRPHDVDWATGAALLVPIAVARNVGEWNEDYFLYSEEVDYFRRIRATGQRIRFEPSAVVTHRGGGSGRSPTLEALKAVNRVRYVEKHHGRIYSTAYRVAIALAEALRSHQTVHRRTFAVVANRRRWRELPCADRGEGHQRVHNGPADSDGG